MSMLMRSIVDGGGARPPVYDEPTKNGLTQKPGGWLVVEAVQSQW
jgi:hypothetical protein